MNLFRALQDPKRRRKLERRLRCTFYARAEFVEALRILKTPDADADDRAWALFVGQNQSFGALPAKSSNWGRTVRPKTSRPQSWWSRVEDVNRWAERLTGVQIEQRDALDVIRTWDSDDATFYLDPPYLQSTRVVPKAYSIETDQAHHEQLVTQLLEVRGACVLSGYASDVYAPLEAAGWARVERDVNCRWRGETAGRRTECAWINERAVDLAHEQASTLA